MDLRSNESSGYLIGGMASAGIVGRRAIAEIGPGPVETASLTGASSAVATTAVIEAAGGCIANAFDRRQAVKSTEQGEDPTRSKAGDRVRRATSAVGKLAGIGAAVATETSLAFDSIGTDPKAVILGALATVPGAFTGRAAASVINGDINASMRESDTVRLQELRSRQAAEA